MIVSDVLSHIGGRRVAPLVWSLEQESPESAHDLPILRTLLDQPRWLESRYLYDERGTRLFERISQLPEYYLTRTEEVILTAAVDEIITLAPVECIVELGAGLSTKTTHLLREQIRQRGGGVFIPVDVSLAALTRSRDMIQQKCPAITFRGLCTCYDIALSKMKMDQAKMIIFFGSNVGNFTPHEFIRFFEQLSNTMKRGDFLLMGVDCLKEVDILERAYNDGLNVTGEFILNAFKHINRIANSDFDLNKMYYCSHYNSASQRVEMYAVSRAKQEIHFPASEVSFTLAEGEPIRVEISRKFDPSLLVQQLLFFDLRRVRHFTDSKKWFSLLLFQKSG